MPLDAFKSDWAAWTALAVLIPVVLIVSRTLYQRSARGLLSRALKEHRDTQKALQKASDALARAESRVAKLQRNAESVKPRALEAAGNTLDDSRALQKILDDKCQVTMNHLRRVIFEEFPPSRHDELRARYLPQDVADGRPFTF